MRRNTAIVAVVALLSAIAAVAAGPSVAHAADDFVPVATVPLGLVETFGILGAAAVGNGATTPVTVIRGDVGAVGALTGFPPGIIEGAVYTSNVGAMITDLQAAYDNAAARTASATLPAGLGGQTAGPGVHLSVGASGTAASGVFTIDGQGHADAVFIFRVNGALALGANTTMNLINGAQAKNVFWQVVGAGSMEANTKFVGTLMASTAVSSGAGSTVNGRLTSTTGAITMDSTQLYSAPPSVEINGGETAYTRDSTPLITGTTSARSPRTVTITITIGSVTTTTTTVTPSADGSWSFQSPDLVNGIHTIVASSVDAVGNVGSDTQYLTVDTVLPQVFIDGDPTATPTNDVSPTISGTTDIAPGQLVTVVFTRTTSAATVTTTTLVQADLTWNVSPNGLSAGEWTVVATVTDPAGNENIDTQIVTIDTVPPVVSITSATLTNDSTPILSGLAEAGSLVTVSIDGRAVAPVTHTTGTWSATHTGPALVDGTHNVFVLAIDDAGNTSTTTQVLIVDTVAPAITVLPGAIDVTNDLTPTIAGTAAVAAGVVVSVSIDGGTAITGLVQSDGSWTATSGELTPGPHSVVATVADPAGNIGSFTQTLTIDLTVPTVIIDGGLSRTTADATPTITGSSPDAPVGSAVVVQVAGQTLPTTLSSDRTFTVTATLVVNGPHVVLVTVTDLAGNNGNTTQSLQVGAVPPTVTITGGGSIRIDDDTPLISGTSNAQHGSPVTVTVAGQRLQAFVQPGGTWNVTAAHLVGGVHTVVATVIDPAGNQNTATQTLMIDTAAAPITTQPPATPVPAPAEFVSVGPKRVFDTRPGQSPDAIRTVAKTPIGGPVELQVQMTDLPGFVPSSGVGAVSLNVTSDGAIADGYITVYACDTREVVSSVNFTAGHTVANAVITPVSGSGDVCFYANTSTDVIVDINGWFATGAAFSAVGPKRVFDTRADSGSSVLRLVPATGVAAGEMLEVQLTDLAGYVPHAGVAAVSLNVVVTNTGGAGYITVYACGTRALVSSVNYVAGQTVANAVIAPVSATGTVCFYSLQAADLVVDINGWLATGSSFHAVDPARVVDTRSGQSPDALRAVPQVKIGGGNVLVVQVTDLAGRVPVAGVSAVSLNVTATNPDGAGYITVYACGALESVSSVNFDAGATVANAVLAPVSVSRHNLSVLECDHGRDHRYQRLDREPSSRVNSTLSKALRARLDAQQCFVDLVVGGLEAGDEADGVVGHPVEEQAGLGHAIGGGGVEAGEQHVDVGLVEELDVE